MARLNADPSYKSLVLCICRDEESAIQFCRHEGIIPDLSQVSLQQNLPNNSRLRCHLTPRCTGRLNDMSYMREYMNDALDTVAPMGGPGIVVQVDESYVRGRRKK